MAGVKPATQNRTYATKNRPLIGLEVQTLIRTIGQRNNGFAWFALTKRRQRAAGEGKIVRDRLKIPFGIACARVRTPMHHLA